MLCSWLVLDEIIANTVRYQYILFHALMIFLVLNECPSILIKCEIIVFIANEIVQFIKSDCFAQFRSFQCDTTQSTEFC